MRVLVSGGTGVIGRAAAPVLVEAGHDVLVLTRNRADDGQVTAAGVRLRCGDLLDPASLDGALAGVDAIVNLDIAVPTGYAMAWPRSWRRHDQLRTTGVANLVAAARGAGIRRIVQQSASWLMADAGDQWVDESAQIEITPATEPMAVAESHVQANTDSCHVGVILRFGGIIGEDPTTRFALRAAGHGRPVGLGDPEGWAHVIHTDDLGSAVLAGLAAPSGVYNVGAEPVLRRELFAAYAGRVGADEATYFGPVLRRLAGVRVEPLGRSLRVCSEKFSAATGWLPSRPRFDADWLAAAADEQVCS